MKILQRRPVRETLFKAATLEPATLLIKRLWQRRFSGNFSWMLIKLTFIIWIAFISLPSSVFIVYLEDQYFYSKEYELPALNYSLIVTFSLWFFLLNVLLLNWTEIIFFQSLNCFYLYMKKGEWVGKTCLQKYLISSNID